MDYITVTEAALRWNVSSRRVQQMCRSGIIDGAVKEGRSWKIPADSNQHMRSDAGSAGPRLPLPVGISSYREAVSRYYYIDKTLLIRDFIDTLPMVTLFTRPRRFGKTLNMDMLRVFFEKTGEDTSVYFRDKAIWSCGEKYRKYQGAYPVIFLTFKDVKYDDWSSAFADISENIRMEYARHSELSQSPKCTDYEKDCYQKIVTGGGTQVDLARSLNVLSGMLHRHYGMPCVIIIDEYDTPIQQGYSAGYYDDVIRFVRNLFSGAFKDNHSLAYGFLTGILRVAKESIFSGMNNLKVSTILDERFSAYFGFTGQEVKDLLEYYGSSDRFREVCEWYDGYRFGENDVFNPWSVINYADEHCSPKAFWQSTGSNEIIGEIIEQATPRITQNLRELMQGGQITTYVDTAVIYPRILDDPSSIYSFLLMAGYLKTSQIMPQNDGNYICRVAVPNREISFVYEKEIVSRLKTPQALSTAALVSQAVFEKDTQMLTQCISQYLLQTISVYDTAGESFYQGLLLGLCAVLNNRYMVRSNRESGLGRFDICLFPVQDGIPGYIMELKSTKDTGEDLDSLAEDAIRQIEAKKYETELRSSGTQEIIKIGIAFCGKRVSVRTA